MIGQWKHLMLCKEGRHNFSLFGLQELLMGVAVYVWLYYFGILIQEGWIIVTLTPFLLKKTPDKVLDVGWIFKKIWLIDHLFCAYVYIHTRWSIYRGREILSSSTTGAWKLVGRSGTYRSPIDEQLNKISCLSTKRFSSGLTIHFIF